MDPFILAVMEEVAPIHPGTDMEPFSSNEYISTPCNDVVMIEWMKSHIS